MIRTNNMPVWLFRCNYIDNASKWPQYKDVTTFYEHNRCPITILFTETWDKYCYETLVNGKTEDVSWETYAQEHPNEKKVGIPRYIKIFLNLAEEVKKQDVLVILEYKDDGKGTGNKPDKKIGIIRKGSKIETYRGDNYELFYLELEPNSVITTQKNQYTILNGLIPSNLTLGPINNREDAINELYHYIKGKTPITLQLQNLPNEKIEDLCCEWLKSSHAKDYKLEKVYVANGYLNFPVLDIMGKTFTNQVLVAQVSYTDNIGTIISKVKKLVMIDTDEHLMFSKLSYDDFTQECKKRKEDINNIGRDVKYIPLATVWNDLYNDKTKKGFIENLFKDSYHY